MASTSDPSSDSSANASTHQWHAADAVALQINAAQSNRRRAAEQLEALQQEIENLPEQPASLLNYFPRTAGSTSPHYCAERESLTAPLRGRRCQQHGPQMPIAPVH